MPAKNSSPIHVIVYNEIVNGKFNPCQPRNNKQDILKNLVFEANTQRVALLPASENPSDYIEATDFLYFGYKKAKDLDIDIKTATNGKHEIIIKPVKVYDLLEVIDIPQFVSFKCNSYVEFMGDEFERIKIRAEWMLDNCVDSKEIKAYALKNVQKAKKIFYDAKRALREVQKTENPEDVYIFFALNLFVVRTIMFYQKMFKPYLTLQPDTEEILFHEVIKELSLKKLCTLFPCGKSGYGEYIKKSFIEIAAQTEGAVQEDPASYEKTFADERSQPVTTGKAKYERIKVNGQINVLVDVFIQMMEKIELEKGMFLETTRENLRDFMVANFKDKNGKPYSYYTLNTYLKPDRTDKHIADNSPRKIDLSKDIDFE